MTASITDYVTDSIQVVLTDEEALTGADLYLLLYVEPATLTGNVTDGTAGVQDVRVHGYDGTMTLLFDVLTDVDGNYDAGISIDPADVTVMFDMYGYAHHEEVVTLVSGANVLDHVLTAAASSDLTGTVTALLGGTPLEAIVTASRTDTGEQIAQVTCGVDGTYTLNLGALHLHRHGGPIRVMPPVPQSSKSPAPRSRISLSRAPPEPCW